VRSPETPIAWETMGPRFSVRVCVRDVKEVGSVVVGKACVTLPWLLLLLLPPMNQDDAAPSAFQTSPYRHV
jgi:hypothetical protein